MDATEIAKCESAFDEGLLTVNANQTVTMNLNAIDKSANGTVRNFHVHYSLHFNGQVCDYNGNFPIFIISKAALEQNKAMSVFKQSQNAYFYFGETLMKYWFYSVDSSYNNGMSTIDSFDKIAAIDYTPIPSTCNKINFNNFCHGHTLPSSSTTFTEFNIVTEATMDFSHFEIITTSTFDRLTDESNRFIFYTGDSATSANYKYSIIGMKVVDPSTQYSSSCTQVITPVEEQIRLIVYASATSAYKEWEVLDKYAESGSLATANDALFLVCHTELADLSNMEVTVNHEDMIMSSQDGLTSDERSKIFISGNTLKI